MDRAFCFCKGEIVDCLPGVVLDCNNKRTSRCPLLPDDEDEAVKQTKAFEQAVKAHQAHKERKGDKVLESHEPKIEREFCFCVGELVDCPAGDVQDCNNKQLRKCPLLAQRGEKQAPEGVQGTKQVGENISSKKSRNTRPSGPKKASSDDGELAFCFCVGEIVDCLPGVVLDCNNKRTAKCPLINDEEDEAEKETRAFEQAVRAHQAHKERKGDRALKTKEVKNAREFCFCLGEMVDCPSATVQDCNLKKASRCKLRE